MVSADTLRGIAFFEGLRTPVLDNLAAAATIVELDNNASVARQHDRAIALYLLLSGNVQFLIEVEGRGKLLVGVGREPGLVIGWSVFRAPYRYTSTVRCEGPCRLLRIPHHVIDDLIDNDPASGLVLLRHVNEALARRLESERERLIDAAATGTVVPPSLPDPIVQTDVSWTADSLQSSQVMVDFLNHSPMFEGLEPRVLDWLAHQAVVETLAPDSELFRQHGIAEHLYLLVDGRVGISYCTGSGERCVFLRAVEAVGDPIGWSALVDPRRYRTSAFAIDVAHVVAMPSNTLEHLCEQKPELGVQILRRVLRAISSRLRFTRIRMVARRYGEQVQAMRAILDQAAESLPVSSALHKIPHLLENRLTLADAFHALELTRAHGNATERNLAELSLELLQDVHRELQFYQGLQKAYETVANAPADLSPAQVRRQSMQVFIELFEPLSWRTAGEELLPDTPGNIVIMNHLENHMDTMLPNEFRLTLDSHFVSSMILYRRYGEAPVRVVRKPETGWFGYQQYFDRLDYLYVYPGDVDEEDQDQALTRERRNHQFVERAAAHLRAGRNLVIAPEGRCSSTENSPGPFRAGAFRLAAAVDPEPWIVPVAVANFDKRLTRTTTAAIVFTPFRLSQHVADPGDRTALFDFVNRLQHDYEGYVQRAIALANS
ncbi:MAG: cyclic nucleotide-binding domain-containing protein [Chromatiaceae bacterium]|nr:cyclic nucleotide-binding domain-containing protein [Chromatiaceae bacterium]MCP5423284.1 cyclic nucleotide-binding domain-containing protein [Chromatiaceae bacterium]